MPSLHEIHKWHLGIECTVLILDSTIRDGLPNFFQIIIDKFEINILRKETWHSYYVILSLETMHENKHISFSVFGTLFIMLYTES